jgi:hypothetical protein
MDTWQIQWIVGLRAAPQQGLFSLLCAKRGKMLWFSF